MNRAKIVRKNSLKIRITSTSGRNGKEVSQNKTEGGLKVEKTGDISTMNSVKTIAEREPGLTIV